MAKRGSGNKKGGKRNNNAKELKSLAYNLGRINKGLTNPNSQISESYNKGKENAGKEKKPRKPLF